MFEISNFSIKNHSYYVFSTGTKLKDRSFNTRSEALDYMYTYCKKHGITVELTEDDKHEKKYSNHDGVRFYINRI